MLPGVPIHLSMFAVVFDRARDALVDGDLRFPIQAVFDPRDIRDIVASLDEIAVFRPLHEVDAGAGRGGDLGGHVLERQPSSRAEVEDVELDVRHCPKQHGIGETVDEYVIVLLRSIAEHGQPLPFECEADELVWDAVLAVSHLLARAIRIGDAKDDGGDVVVPVVELIELLAIEFVDAVDAQAIEGMALVDGIVLDVAVNETGTREGELGVGACSRQASSTVRCPLALMSRSLNGSRLLST